MVKTAQDLMNREVITIDSTASAEELAVLLDEEGIHGVPVVDPSGAPVGVVSRTDLALAREENRLRPREEEVSLDEADSERMRAGLDGISVTDIMSTDIVEAGKEATAAELAQLMLKEKVNRVLITEDGRIAGIVSIRDLLPCLIEYEKAIRD